MTSGVRNRDVGSLLAEAFVTWADRPALVDEASGETLRYADAARAVERIAARLTELGVGAGDRLLIRSATSLPAVLSCWAAWRIGAVPAPTDPSWPPWLVAPLLGALAPRLELRDEGLIPASGNVPSFVVADRQGFPAEAFLEWVERSEGPGDGGGAPGPFDGSAPGAILFTSGSTGEPKGVVLSRGALAHSAALVVSTFRLGASDRFLNLGGLHAMSGLRNTCLSPAACGAAALVISPAAREEPFLVERSLRALGATALGTGPATLRLLVGIGDRLDPSAWRRLGTVITTGARLSPADARAFLALAGRPAIDYYGLTETTGLCISHTPESAGAFDGTLGWPVGAACEILDDSGRPVPHGEDGELAIAGENLMLGYLGRPDLTATVLREGRFHTGDQARRHADGRIELVGRRRSFVKTSRTDLLFPEEVERALEGHPRVADAAAACIRRSEGAERLVLFFVPRGAAGDGPPLERELHGFLRERLGPHRLPHGYRCVERIPRLGSGKVDRRTLEEWSGED
jgi:acyl-coenzyme A synthetase/AMP-(fatty) acid ligase